MNRMFLLILSVFSIGVVFSQNEYKLHLSSIDSSYNTARAFVDYTITNSLLKSSDYQFISNRNLLPKLKPIYRDSTKLMIRDSLVTGEVCLVNIELLKFDSTKHHIIKYSKDELYDNVDFIDSLYPYGGEYALPDFEISSLEIIIDGKQIIIPEKAYSNFYDPNILGSHGFMKEIEAFSSMDGQFIYIYIYGGQAASTYFTKLIFNKEKYLTQIVSNYYDLSINSSFRPNFIGY